jgi:hypothetical protein
MNRLEITGQDQRPSITGEAGGAFSPEVLDWLKKNGIAESDYRTAVERTAGNREIKKTEAYFEEFNRLQRVSYAYERRQREARAKGR